MVVSFPNCLLQEPPAAAHVCVGQVAVAPNALLIDMHITSRVTKYNFFAILMLMFNQSNVSGKELYPLPFANYTP